MEKGHLIWCCAITITRNVQKSAEWLMEGIEAIDKFIGCEVNPSTETNWNLFR
jgi:hypothetical protein